MPDGPGLTVLLGEGPVERLTGDRGCASVRGALTVLTGGKPRMTPKNCDPPDPPDLKGFYGTVSLEEIATRLKKWEALGPPYADVVRFFAADVALDQPVFLTHARDLVLRHEIDGVEPLQNELREAREMIARMGAQQGESREESPEHLARRERSARLGQIRSLMGRMARELGQAKRGRADDLLRVAERVAGSPSGPLPEAFVAACRNLDAIHREWRADDPAEHQEQLLDEAGRLVAFLRDALDDDTRGAQ